MSASTRFAVAIHALTNIALNGGVPIRSEDIARSVNTNPVVIRAIISRLNAAGMIRTQLGAGGGFQLAKPAEAIRLLDIYAATEDKNILPLHRNPPNPLCPVGSVIQGVLIPVFDQAQAGLERELAGVTLADIALNVARLSDSKATLGSGNMEPRLT